MSTEVAVTTARKQDNMVEFPWPLRAPSERFRLIPMSWLGLLVSAAASGACGAETSEPVSRGEAQFLQQCGVRAKGYHCVGGVCSRTCDTQGSMCKGLPGAPSCTDDAGLGQAICDVSCDDDSDCRAVGYDYTCNDGFCRLEHDGSSDISNERSCTYQGLTYPLGAEFACGDGCNTCSCTEQGIQHPLLGCPEPTCQYDGRMYESGDSWDCVDGCNTCSCVEGAVVQTDLGCDAPLPDQACEYDGQTYADGERWTCADGCNICFCVGGNVQRTLVGC